MPVWNGALGSTVSVWSERTSCPRRSPTPAFPGTPPVNQARHQRAPPPPFALLPLSARFLAVSVSVTRGLGLS